MEYITIKIDNQKFRLPLTSNNLLVSSSGKGKTNFCKKLCGLVPSKLLVNDIEINDFNKFVFFNNNHLFLSNSIKEEINENIMVSFNNDINPNNLSLINKIKLFILSLDTTNKVIVIFDNVYDLLDNIHKNVLIDLINTYLKNQIVIITSNNLITYNIFDNVFLYDNEISNITNLNQNLEIIDNQSLELPFLLNISRKLAFYELIDKNYDSIEQLVGDLWK